MNNPSEDNKKFVLLDRDGTIMVDGHYLSDPEEVQLLPGAINGLSMLQKAGFGLVIVTNQAGIGRGYYTEADMRAVNRRLEDLLRKNDINIDAIYFCPHSPDAGCDCRKPEPGMVMKAARDFNFFPNQIFVIGDKACDIDLALNVKAKAVLVLTGYGHKQDEETKNKASHVAENLEDAARWIIKQIND